MKTYAELRDICERTSRVSARVVDDFLIAYAAGHRGLEKKMNSQFDRFQHVGRQLGKDVVNMLKSQYLAHKIFRKDGLLLTFLKHPALDRFTGEERTYLLEQMEQPWRFSFSVLVDRPAEDFFMMEDVFTGEQYLLFSPGISNIKASANPLLWFNLIGYNGACWQSYGPVGYYNGFEPGDIWFYATELNPDLDEPREIMADLELDPLPYMMLLSGSTLPLSFHNEDQLLFLLSEHDMSALHTAGLKKEFKTEYDSGVYRISHKDWGAHPHYAQAFFDEKENLLLFSAMTDRGFSALVEAFNTFGHEFSAEPYLRVNMSMLSTASEILKKKIVLNEYLDLFEEPSDPEKDKVLEDINAFIALVLPDINAGKQPDIEEAARLSGVDPETAYSVVESVMGSLADMPVPGEKSPGKSPGKSLTSKKQQTASKQLPVQPAEGIRLLSSDDELLFDLHLYMMADDIRRMAPWDYLYENDLFGVQVPGTDLVYYVSVMGNEGEFRALSIYKGSEGLTDFLEFSANVDQLFDQELSEEGMLRASTMIGNPMCIPHLMLSFMDREELEKKDLAAIKKSGKSFRGKGNWPRIEEIVPCYLPVYPQRDILIDLFLVMQQTILVLKRAIEDEACLIRKVDPDGALLVRIPTGKGPKFRWKDHYLAPDPEWEELPYSVNIADETCSTLSRLPETSQTLQLDLFMLPTPVKEKGSRGYFPFVLMLVEKGNGLIRSTSILAPQPDLRSMYESLSQRVVDELIKSGHRPSKIEVRTDLLFDMLLEILDEAGCSVEWADRMPEMDEAIVSMISGFTKH